eukprot:ctg_302.g121
MWRTPPRIATPAPAAGIRSSGRRASHPTASPPRGAAAAYRPEGTAPRRSEHGARTPTAVDTPDIPNRCRNRVCPPPHPPPAADRAGIAARGVRAHTLQANGRRRHLRRRR